MTKNLNLGNFLTILRSTISKSKFFLENRFHSNWRSYLVLTQGQKPKKLLEPFLRKISKWLFWANMETFSRISPNQELFFKKPALWLFCLYSPLTSCEKSQKSLQPLLRKLRYQPTNQPTNYYQQHRSYVYIHKICFDYSLDFLVVVEILKCNFKPEMAVSFNALKKLTEEDLWNIVLEY